jgi:hypothetical protein
MKRARFVLPEGSDFQTIHASRHADNLGEIINTALEKIELENEAKLKDVFRGAQGAAMAHLNRPALACLSIPLPSIPRQLAIGRLATAAAREWEIVHEIAELSHRLRQELLHRMMEEARTGEAIPKRGHIPGPNDAVTSSALPSAPKQKVPLK